MVVGSQNTIMCDCSAGNIDLYPIDYRCPDTASLVTSYPSLPMAVYRAAQMNAT